MVTVGIPEGMHPSDPQEHQCCWPHLVKKPKETKEAKLGYVLDGAHRSWMTALGRPELSPGV